MAHADVRLLICYKAPRMKPNKKTIIISEVNIIGKVQFKFLFISYMYK